MIKKEFFYRFITIISATLLLLQIYLTYKFSQLFPLEPTANVWLPELWVIALWLLLAILAFLKIKYLKYILLILSPWLIYGITQMLPQITQPAIPFKIAGIASLLYIALIISDLFLFFIKKEQKKRYNDHNN